PGALLVNTPDRLDAAGLFHAALHEAGHVLGIPNSADPLSPMFPRLSAQNSLTAGDVQALRAMYGARGPDANEGSSNNDTFAHATQLAFPSGGYTGATPLMAFGDVGSASDVDVFALRPMSNYTGPVTFQLRSAGLSLLAPKITIFDARGNVLGQAQSTNPQGDTVSVRLAAVNPQATYFVRVEGATRDVFGIGRYALVTTFD